MKFNPLDWLFSDKKKEAEGIISSIGTTFDNLVTSDKERKVLQVQLERLSALNKSTFVAGGRSAIMYALAAVIVYQAVLRDILAGFFGVTLPPTDIDLAELIMKAFQLMAGTL